MARRRYHSRSSYRQHDDDFDEAELAPSLGRLQRLLPYYLECVREDSQQGARHFLTDEGERFFVHPFEREWSSANQASVAITFDSQDLLKALRQQGNTGALFYGYPLFVDWIAKSQSGWSGGFAIPVFLVPIEYSQYGKTLEIRLTNEAPRLNGEFLERVFRSGEERRAFLHDIGLSDVEAEEQPTSTLSDMARRLADLDVAPQVEPIDPDAIRVGSVAGISGPGLYNRHIIVLGDRTKFTVGLERELGLLSKSARASMAGSTVGGPVRRA